MVTLVQVSIVSVRQAVRLAWLCRILAAALAPFIPIQRTVRLLLCGVSGVTLAVLLVEAGQVGPEAVLLQAGVVGQLQQFGGQLEHRPLSHHFRVYRLTLLHGKQQGTEHFTPSCVLFLRFITSLQLYSLRYSVVVLKTLSLFVLRLGMSG